MQVIFTSGFEANDDDVAQIKGFRGDVLLLDDEGHYFEVNFATIESLKIDLNYGLNLGKKYYTDICLIVLESVTKDNIISANKDISSHNYFKRFATIQQIEKTEKWSIINLE